MTINASIQESYLQKEKEYWLAKLAGELHQCSLPSELRDDRTSLDSGDAVEFSFEPDFTEKLVEASRGNDVLLFAILVGALKICLHKYTGLEDILVGSTIHERHRTAAFSNRVLVLRARIEDAMTPLQVLDQVRRTIVEAYANQRYPYAKLRQLLKTTKALFGIAIVLETIHDPAHLCDGEQQVILQFALRNKKLAAKVCYKPSRLRRETCQQFAEHYGHVLREVLDFPRKPVALVQLFSPEQKRELILQRNRSRKEYPRNAIIPTLFEDQAALRPAATALQYRDRILSYDELNSKANQWAHYLRKKGAGPEVAVGISVDRSLETIIGLLAILKAGATYVPLDLDYPLEQQEMIVRDSGLGMLLITNNRTAHWPAGVELIRFDTEQAAVTSQPRENLSCQITAENLAYIMYTSGSTGIPKGVAITHRGVVRLVKEANYVELGPAEKILHFAPLSFDASSFEIWGSLLNGGELVVMSAGQPSLEALGTAIRAHAISTMWLTAGLFHMMVEHCLEDLKGVRQLLAGGDVVSVPHAQKFLQANPQATLIDGYGPTENTTFTCCYRMRAGMEIGTSVPIGLPISNTEVHIVDQNFEPVAVGVVGELYTGGEGLARGYVNGPELTAEKFVPNPFSDREGERLYRTGDLARYRWDGSIEFVGRADQQVKIRGYRIELSEIETVLGRHEGVRGNVVVAENNDSGDKHLTAYVVADEEVTKTELRRYLEEKLPAHMVPSVLVRVEAIPLTENGKIDRAKLANQKANDRDQEDGEMYVAPRNELEEAMAALWKEVLGKDRIGIFDNFFDLGGHSLLAMKICARMNGKLTCRTKVTDLFLHPTIDSLARHLGEKITASTVAV